MAEMGVEEAAVRLGLSSHTVRRQVKQGKIEARHDSNGRLLITLPDVVEQPHSNSYSNSHSSDEQAHSDEAERLAGLLEAAERHRDSLETMISGLREQLEAQRRQIEAGETERSELRQLLAARDQAESELRQLLLQAQLQVQALIPKLAPPEEAQQPRKPWWRWWG